VVLTHKGLAFNATDESSLGLLDGLQHIDVVRNALTGPVPEWLLNLTSLNFVSFNNNQLTGTVPAELGALTGLNWLDLWNNHLTGTVPALPFKQYTRNCCLSPNKFSCPLPADAAACICNGKPGVACT
jgi:hypothetical protein